MQIEETFLRLGGIRKLHTHFIDPFPRGFLESNLHHTIKK